jgi:hypothetical protein
VVVNTKQMASRKPSESPGMWQRLVADAQVRGCFFEVLQCR